jgi:zinc protease
MKKTLLKTSLGVALSALMVAGFLSACSSLSSSDKTKSGGFLGSMSGGSDNKTGYQLPPFKEKKLENGLTVLIVPDDKLPYVNYSLLLKIGSAQDPQGLGGLSAMVAEVLDKGTKKRKAQQIAAELGQMGAEIDANAGLEYTVLSGSALSMHAEPLLSNMIEILTEPTFADQEIERMRKQVLAGIEHRIDNPDAFAELAFESFLYGDHPYARPVIGNAKSVAQIKKKHIIQHYLRYYRPNNAILSVVGKLTPALEEKIIAEFSKWPARDVPQAKFPLAPSIKDMQIELVDKPGLVQSQIRLGHLGITRQNEDFISLRVANTILGGAFASRLNDRVRKNLGLTYSISSSFDPRKDRGPFEISTFTKNETVAQTVRETLGVLGAFREKGVTSEELDMAKGYLKGVFPQAIETPEKLALNLMLLRFYEVPDTYLTSYLNEIDRVRIGDVNQVIKKYFDDQHMKVVVYSNAKDAEGQLAPLAKSLGGEFLIKKASEISQ